MRSFVRMRTMYRQKGTTDMSPDFVSVLPKCLTVDPSYVTRRFFQGNRTLFREVEIVPYKEAMTEEMRLLFDMSSPWESTEEELFSHVYSALKYIIRHYWQRAPVHAVLHSSGIDSRVMSWLIHEIYRDNGPGWLGQTVFLCSDREAPGFLKIMEFEGWPEELYHVVRRQTPVNRYYEHDLTDFKYAWKRLNGMSGLPVNLFWYPIAWAQRKGYLPADGEEPIQTWTGYWGNTILDGASTNGGKGVLHNCARNYRGALSMRPIKGDTVIRPYTHMEVAMAVCANQLRLGKRFRHRFVRWINPTLASFKNIDAEGDRFRPVAPDIRQRCQSDYDNSWYGKNVAPGVRIPAEIEFHDGWSRWCSASLCEWLRNNGYTLEIA